MRSQTKAVLATAVTVLAAWVGWGSYANRSTDQVPYERLDSFDDVELRRYPQSVLVETTDDDQRTAFGRLFRYISGANESAESVAMTAPVRTRGDEAPSASLRALSPSGETVPMTAPVRTDSTSDAVTMAFYLPSTYAPETAPTPTDPAVRLVVEPPRTIAARRFSWYATANRVERQRRALLRSLEREGIETVGEPTVLQYNDPWTPPFMRRNEVAVQVIPPEADAGAQ